MPRGWQESGSRLFEGDTPEDAADKARAYLPPGLIRSWPAGYGGTQVIEYWSEPEAEGDDLGGSPRT